MITKQLSYKQIHDDDKIWLIELDNHWDEIQGFRQRLSEWTNDVSNMEMDVDEQHFKLQFQILELAIKNLTKKIKLHHREPSPSQFELSNLLSEGQYYDKHEGLRREIGAFRILHLEYQREFYGFLAKWKLKTLVTHSSIHSLN